MPRATCERCQKATVACVCKYVTTIDNHIPVVILQHFTECRHALNTAKILNLSLTNCHIYCGENFSDHESLNHLLNSAQHECLLMFPGEQAQCLQSEYRAPDERQPVLLLLDGTWRKARKILYFSDNISNTKRVTIPMHLQSKYRIRKAPGVGMLSTLEAAFHALSLLENNFEKFLPLLPPFYKMIDFQIAQMGEQIYRRNYLDNVTLS